jgi:hypothetical protein
MMSLTFQAAAILAALNGFDALRWTQNFTLKSSSSLNRAFSLLNVFEAIRALKGKYLEQQAISSHTNSNVEFRSVFNVAIVLTCFNHYLKTNPQRRITFDRNPHGRISSFCC